MKSSIDYKALNQRRIKEMLSVDLADFLIQNFGYKLIAGRPQGQSEKIIEGNAGKLNIFWDKRTNSGWRYKNWQTGETGQIIQYLRRHERFECAIPRETMESIYQFICDRTGVIGGTSLGIPRPQETLINQETFDLRFDTRPGGFEYLQSRGLQKSILTHSIFSDAVKNILYKPLGYQGIGFYNTAYVIRDSSGNIVSAEMINCRNGQSFRSQPKGVVCGDGIIHSKFPAQHHGCVKAFIIGEAYTDVLSFAQLYIKPEQFKDYIFIGSYGSLSDLQIGHIQKLVNRFNPGHIYLINDNDIAGMVYDLKLMSGLSKEQGRGTIVNYSHDKVSQRAHLRISFNEATRQVYLVEELYARLDNLMIARTSNKPFAVTKDITGIDVQLQHNLNDIKIVLDIVAKIFNQDGFISTRKAEGKDFNEQLMRSRCLSPSDIIPNTNPYLRTVPYVDIGLPQNFERLIPPDNEIEL